MLKRIVLLVVVLVLSLFVVRTPLYSQELLVKESEATFEQARAKYVDSIDEYNKSYNDYLLRRSQYLKFQSLKSRQDAFDATLWMLEKRDDVVLSYLELLIIKLNTGVGIPDPRKNELLLRIGDEKYWFTDHKNNLSTTGSLEDLVKDSNLAANRWERIDPLASEVMSVLSQGVIAKYSERLDDLFDEVRDKLELIRSEERQEYILSSNKFGILDRWVFEAESKIIRSKEKQEDAQLIISDLPKSKDITARTYNSVVEELEESRLYMKDAISFIREIIRQVKIAE